MILPFRKRRNISKISCLEKSQKQKNKSSMSWNYIDNSRQLLRRRPFMISPVSPSILTKSTFGGWDVKRLIETRDRTGKRIESNETKWSFLITSIAKKFICVYTWASGVGAFWLEFSSFSLNLLAAQPIIEHTIHNQHQEKSREPSERPTDTSHVLGTKKWRQLRLSSFLTLFSPLPYTFSVCQIDKLSCEFLGDLQIVSLTGWGSYEAAHVSFFFWRCRAMSVLRDWFLLVLASNFLHNFFHHSVGPTTVHTAPTLCNWNSGNMTPRAREHSQAE